MNLFITFLYSPYHLSDSEQFTVKYKKWSRSINKNKDKTKLTILKLKYYRFNKRGPLCHQPPPWVTYHFATLMPIDTLNTTLQVLWK